MWILIRENQGEKEVESKAKEDTKIPAKKDSKNPADIQVPMSLKII